MDHYAGIDVSLEYASVCVVEASGKIVREGKVLSEPAALIAWFCSLGFGLARIGLEAGPLSQWLYLDPVSRKGSAPALSLFDGVVVRMLVTPEPHYKLRPEVLFGSDARQGVERAAPGNFTFGTVLDSRRCR